MVMKLSILQKYLIKEFISSFFIALFILSFILSTAQLFEIQNKTSGSLGFIDSLIMCFYILVEYSHLIIPMSLLYSLLLVFAKLTTQHEIIALNSCGVTKYIFIKPILFISLFFFFSSLLLSGFAAPICYQKLKLKLFDVIQKKSMTFLQEGIFNEDFFHYIIYIEKIDKQSNELKNIILFNKNQSDNSFHPEGIIFAQSGFLNVQATPFSIMFYLKNGVYNFPMKEGVQKVEFHNAALRLNTKFPIREGFYEKKQMLDVLFSNRNKDSMHRYVFDEKLNLSLASALFGFLALALTFLSYQFNKGLALLLTLGFVFVYFGYFKYLMSILGSLKMGYIPYLMAIPNVIVLFISCFILYRAYNR